MFVLTKYMRSEVYMSPFSMSCYHRKSSDKEFRQDTEHLGRSLFSKVAVYPRVLKEADSRQRVASHLHCRMLRSLLQSPLH